MVASEATPGDATSPTGTQADIAVAHASSIWLRLARFWRRPPHQSTAGTAPLVWSHLLRLSPDAEVHHLNRAALILVGLLILSKAVVAAVVPLVPDETYYALWSQGLAFGYYDHPPMIAVFIRLGTTILGQSPLGVRLFSVLATIPTSWFVWKAADIAIADRRDPAVAVALFNLTLFGYLGQAMATPDAPQALFAAAMVYYACLLLIDARWSNWMGLGLASGLALQSKYSAFLLLAGILLGLSSVPAVRPRLREPGPYLAAMTAMIVFLPNLIWNFQNDWVTFAKQGGRVVAHLTFDPRFFAELFLAQAGIVTPLIFGFALLGLLPTAKSKFNPDGRRLLLAAILVPSGYFLFHALRARVEGNWPDFIYPAFSISAAAAVLMETDDRKVAALRASVVPLGLLLAALVTLHVSFPGGLPERWEPRDPVVRMTGGWKEFAHDVDALRSAAGATHILTDSYQLNAELAWFLRAVPVEQVNQRDRYRNLAQPAPETLVGPALFVSSSKTRFRNAVPKATLTRYFSGVPVESVTAFILQTPIQPMDLN